MARSMSGYMCMRSPTAKPRFSTQTGWPNSVTGRTPPTLEPLLARRITRQISLAHPRNPSALDVPHSCGTIAIVRDWYIGCAQPSQGCETSSTLVSRSLKSLFCKHLRRRLLRDNFAVQSAVQFGKKSGTHEGSFFTSLPLILRQELDTTTPACTPGSPSFRSRRRVP